MRHHARAITAAILFSFFLLPGFAAAQTPPPAPAGGATARLQETLDSILTTLLDPKLKQQDPAARMQTVQALFRKRFDEVNFCKRALGRHWNERTEAEQAEFTRLFSDLLMSTYLERIDGYLNVNKTFTHQNISYQGERATETYTLVTTAVQTEPASTIPVLYRMEKINGDWMVTDIAIEGISLLQNYRAQFNEIIANAGYPELLKRLKEKKV